MTKKKGAINSGYKQTKCKCTDLLASTNSHICDQITFVKKYEVHISVDYRQTNVKTNNKEACKQANQANKKNKIHVRANKETYIHTHRRPRDRQSEERRAKNRQVQCRLILSLVSVAPAAALAIGLFGSFAALGLNRVRGSCLGVNIELTRDLHEALVDLLQACC